MTIASDALTARGAALPQSATRLTERLRRPVPQLGVFLPAGFPSPHHNAIALRLFAARGADILEVGVPHHHAPYDGPLVSAAYQQALRDGTCTSDVMDTVHRVATTTDASIIVMTYWEPVHACGTRQFARDLAAADAAGAMIVDLPSHYAPEWIAAAREAGIHTPHLVARDATDQELARTATVASGWVYAPAAEALTGYTGELDIRSLAAFTRRLQAAGPTPVVTGIGVSTPAKAAQVKELVDSFVIGSPLSAPCSSTAHPKACMRQPTTSPRSPTPSTAPFVSLVFGWDGVASPISGRLRRSSAGNRDRGLRTGHGPAGAASSRRRPRGSAGRAGTLAVPVVRAGASRPRPSVRVVAVWVIQCVRGPLDLVQAGRELVDFGFQLVGRVAEFVFLLRDPAEEFFEPHAAARTSSKAGPGYANLRRVVPVSRQVIVARSSSRQRASRYGE
ncbi:tryptophan synthase subunit alpha [Streptomyces sp. NPDC002403]